MKLPKTRAFTLIELLVVIAIVGVLAALLLPVLSKAKEQGNKAQCMSNLRQLQIAWLTYSTDNDGWLPRNDGGQTAGRRQNEPSWTSGWLDYKANNTDNTNTWIMLNNPYGSIGRYTQNPGIYKCPSDKSWALIQGKKHSRVRSYSMNSLMGSSQFSFNASYRIYRKMGDLGRPPVSQHIVFLDEHEDSIDDGLFHVAINSKNILAWIDWPGTRHSRSANISFADGHVETKKWEDPRTLKPVKRVDLPAEVTPENKDVIWLWDRATADNRR